MLFGTHVNYAYVKDRYISAWHTYVMVKGSLSFRHLNAMWKLQSLNVFIKTY